MYGELEIVAITLAAAAIAAASQYVFKKNIKKFKLGFAGIVSVLKNRQMVLGLGMYLVSFLLYIYALHAAPILSFVYPVFASTFVFVLLISKYALNEQVSIARALGIFCIIAGIMIVSLTYP